MSAERALTLGQEHVFERQSVVDERILLREALIAGRGEVRLEHLRGALASRLLSGELMLLVGDVKQHHSVEAGDALRSLQKYAEVETVRLQEIHRQENESYRRVVRLLASGKPQAAFTQLNELGGIREEKNWRTLLDQAASAYVEKLQVGQSCLAISPVWSEVNAFTTVLRERLKLEGALEKEERPYKAVQSLQWTRSLKMQPSNYQIGDVVTFQRDGEGFSKHEMGTVVANDGKHLTLERSNGSRSIFDPKSHAHFDVGLPRVISVASGEKLLVRSNFSPEKLKNGDLVTVDQVKDDGRLLLRDGRTIPAHFRQFTHGYATTSHAAQGKTVDHGILVLGEKGYQAANLKQAYVSNSRFRLSQTIFTTDKERAYGAMASQSERPLALETIKTDSQGKSQLPHETAGKSPSPSPSVTSPGFDWTPTETKRGIRL